MARSSKWSLFLRFPHQRPVYTSPLPYMLHAPPISFSRYDHSNNIVWGAHVIKLLIM
jgi:hypothetical protein